eukprot:scaffold143527_cov65-Attheya_sp.AAC.1
MMSTMEDIAPSVGTMSMRSRLRAAKKAVREATEQALKAAASEETLIGGGLETLGKPPGDANDMKFKSTSTEATSLSTDGENMHPNRASELDDGASFELGMQLFGDDVAAIESEVSAKLDTVEAELTKIMNAEKAQKQRTNDISEDSKGDQQRDVSMANPSDEHATKLEIQKLTIKISFLRECSKARVSLDKSGSVSISPSGDGLVEASTLLARAEESLGKAEAGLSTASEKMLQTDTGAKELEAAERIVDSIRVQIRRRRVDFLARASTILDACIQVTPTSISVRLAPSQKGISSNHSSQGLEAAFDAIQELSKSPMEKKDKTVRYLEESIHLLTSKLHCIILEPMISGYERNNITKHCHKGWKFCESTKDDSTGLLRTRSGASATTIKGPILMLSWSAKDPEADASKSDSHDSNIVAWTHALEFISSFMGFVYERVLLKRQLLCNIAGRILFGNSTDQYDSAFSAMKLEGLTIGSVKIGEQNGLLTKKMLDIMWDVCIPKALPSTDLHALSGMAQKLQMSTRKFEDDLHQWGFLKQNSSGAMTDESNMPNVFPISDFANNFVLKFSEKRRSMILSEGRDLLLKNDYHVTVKVGTYSPEKIESDNEDSMDFGDRDDEMSVFQLHECAISQVASNLLGLCRKTMEEATDHQVNNAGPSLALLPPTLYRTARELLDLYRAIVPAAHWSEVSTIPRTAAVLHNDCVFFAHHLLSLGNEFRTKFPPLMEGGDVQGNVLRQMCTFVDLVPPFRSLADKALGDMIERQKFQLMDIVASRLEMLGKAVESNENVTEWTDAETALTAGLYHLRHIAQAWRPILSHDVFARAMGNLVDTLLLFFLDQIMKAKGISVPASHFLSALFRDAIRGTADLFDGSSYEKKIKAASTNCELWDRFIAVGKFVDMSLADINVGLSEGVFKSVTGSELSQLILAAFDHSDKRAKLLHALASN